MFERLPRTDVAEIRIVVDGKPVSARAGDTVAAALIAAGMIGVRANPVNGDVRGPYCLMGICQDCRVAIDGRPDTQACTTQVVDGMRIDLASGRGDG